MKTQYKVGDNEIEPIGKSLSQTLREKFSDEWIKDKGYPIFTASGMREMRDLILKEIEELEK